MPTLRRKSKGKNPWRPVRHLSSRRQDAHWRGARRTLLRRALAKDGFLLMDFAEKLGVTHTHLNLVLRQKRTSQRIDVAVWEVIAFVHGERTARAFRVKSPRGMP